jgi:hypothetical protein
MMTQILLEKVFQNNNKDHQINNDNINIINNQQLV